MKFPQPSEVNVTEYIIFRNEVITELSKKGECCLERKLLSTVEAADWRQYFKDIGEEAENHGWTVQLSEVQGRETQVINLSARLVQYDLLKLVILKPVTEHVNPPSTALSVILRK